MIKRLVLAANVKDYKGSVVARIIIRVILMTKLMIPDLYEIMKFLGKDRVKFRVDNV